MSHAVPSFSKRGTNTTQQGGFILLLSVLIISIILAISFGLFDITIKELAQASFLRSSATAFNAADRGIECALFWDRAPTPLSPQAGITYTIFATSSVFGYTPPANLNNATCDGHVLTASNWVLSRRAPKMGQTDFTLNFADNGSYVDVTVLKDGTGPDGDITTITANGYNSSSAANPRRTQRTIQVRTNF